MIVSTIKPASEEDQLLATARTETSWNVLDVFLASRREAIDDAKRRVTS